MNNALMALLLLLGAGSVSADNSYHRGTAGLMEAHDAPAAVEVSESAIADKQQKVAFSLIVENSSLLARMMALESCKPDIIKTAEYVALLHEVSALNQRLLGIYQQIQKSQQLVSAKPEPKIRAG